METSREPRCVFVTGPMGAGKTRWLRDFIMRARGRQPTVKFAVILAEHGKTTLDDLATQTPTWLTVNPLVLPCLCCPGAADLPRLARETTEATNADWVLAEVPTLVAVGLVAETERQLGWPCTFVAVFPDADGTRQRKLGSNMPFFGRLFARANAVVREPNSAAEAISKLLDAGC